MYPLWSVGSSVLFLSLLFVSPSFANQCKSKTKMVQKSQKLVQSVNKKITKSEVVIAKLQTRLNTAQSKYSDFDAQLSGRCEQLLELKTRKLDKRNATKQKLDNKRSNLQAEFNSCDQQSDCVGLLIVIEALDRKIASIDEKLQEISVKFDSRYQACLGSIDGRLASSQSKVERAVRSLDKASERRAAQLQALSQRQSQLAAAETALSACLAS